MKRKIIAMLACQFIAVFFAAFGTHGPQTLTRAKKMLQPELGISLCSLPVTGGEDSTGRSYLVLLNLNGERIGGQLDFDKVGSIDLVTGTYRGVGCH